MRDLIIIAIVAAGALVALRRPWIGVMLWTWLSIMNPHRYAWGIAYDAPLAAVAAASVLLGLLLTKERDSPLKGAAPKFLVAFMVWITLSWQFGLNPTQDYETWDKVMKIDLMILVALSLLRTKQHIFALAWVVAGSLALLGAKGGLFTLLGGGAYRVYGPPSSFIEDNNDFALAVVITIPLLRFLQTQLKGFWAVHGMTLVMILCAASAFGSYSRGALLAIFAMGLLLWWRGRRRVLGGLVIIVVAVALLAFMPGSWTERMWTIPEYQEDDSALGRISAWWTAWGIAQHYPFGAGFDTARADLFAAYSPYPDSIHAAHSIYFQMLGSHGFVGLALFLGIFVSTWRAAGWLRKQGNPVPEAQWCAELGAMCQVSLVGYAVGGAFLGQAYFDLPYNVMVLVMLTRVWVQTKAWQREPAYAPGWRTIPGLATAAPK